VSAAVLASLDALRAFALRRVGRVAPRLLARRQERVGLYGALTVATALLFTCVAPIWTLALGPIVLGVPHLLADLRYMVLRPGLHRRLDVAFVVGAPLGATLVWPHACVGLLALVGAALVARGSPVWRSLVAAAGVGSWIWSREHVWLSDLVVAHGHNLFAVVLWWAWSERTRRYHWPVLAAFAVAAAVVGSGAVDTLVPRWGSSSPHAGLNLATFVSELAPSAGGVLGLRLVLAFAFAQSVHYGVWLRLIPEEDRPRPGIRSFASSFRALRRDVGLPLLVVTGCALASVAAWALVDVRVARHAYLRVAGFHAYLELGAAALLLLEGNLRRRVAC
jgi:hypothetical protein